MAPDQPQTIKGCDEMQRNCKATQLRWMLFVLGVCMTMIGSAFVWSRMQASTDSRQDTKIEIMERQQAEAETDTRQLRALIQDTREAQRTLQAGQQEILRELRRNR